MRKIVILIVRLNSVNPSKQSVQISDQTLLLFSFVILIGSIFTSIVTPFSMDHRIMMSAAFLTDFNGPFPTNLDNSWENKPVGNRLIMYFLYKTASIFTGFQDKILFEVGIKAINVLITTFSVCLFILSIRKLLLQNNISPLFTTIFLLFALFSLSYLTSMMPEYFTLIILAISFVFLDRNSIVTQFFSGFLAGFLFPLKGVTLIFILYLIIATIYLYKDWRKKLLIALSGFMVFFFIMILLSTFLFHNAIPDFLDSSLFNLSLIDFNIINRVVGSIIFFLNLSYHIPVLLPAFILAFFIFVNRIIKFELKDAGVFFILWTIPFIPIIIQGKYLPYYYVPFIIPAVFSVIYYCTLNQKKNGFSDEKVLFISFSGILVIYFFVCLIQNLYFKELLLQYFFHDAGKVAIIISIIIILSILCVFGYIHSLKSNKRCFCCNKHIAFFLCISAIIWIIFQSPIGIDFTWNKEVSTKLFVTSEELGKKFNFTEVPEILYLESGLGPYLFNIKSHCRYYYPLPVQRARYNPQIMETNAYLDTMHCISSYNGSIVILEPFWFDLSSPDKAIIKKKLDEEYKDSFSDFSSSTMILKRTSVLK